jgi:hypothetical protein
MAGSSNDLFPEHSLLCLDSEHVCLDFIECSSSDATRCGANTGFLGYNAIDRTRMTFLFEFQICVA